MEQYFVPRTRAIALIVSARKALLAHADERLPADAKRMRDDAAALERLLLDVRAARVDSFQLMHPTAIHVVVSSE